jgi:hypothetical protein
MAGFNIVELQDAITAQVKALFPNTEVFEDTIPDDANLPQDETGKLVPYIVLRYGPIRPSYTGHSFMGPRYDEYWASCDLIAISGNGRVSRKLNAALVGQMIGFKPDGTYPMQMRTDAGDPAQFVVSSNESRPTQYVSTTRLRFGVNAVDPGSAVTIP